MYKKISTLFIIFSIFLGIAFIQPKKVQAQIPVTDVAHIGISTGNAVVSTENAATNTVTTAQKVWEVLKQTVLQPMVVSMADQMLDNLVSKTISWANNGFEGSPGFITNWGDFVKNTQYDVLAGAFRAASITMAEIEKNNGADAENKKIACLREASLEYNQKLGEAKKNSPTGVVPVHIRDSLSETYNTAIEECEKISTNLLVKTGASAAEANYNLWNSGDVVNIRNITRSIQEKGYNTINNDPVNSIINGEGNTLKRLLGTQQNVDNFNNNISVGGWGGYVALADPHNYPSGLQSLVSNALGKKTYNVVTNTITDVQTPTKFLDKKECLEKDPTDSTKCLRQITVTPGQQVSSLVSSSLTKDQTKTGELNDQLMLNILGQAIGSLTDGLIQTGLNKITQGAANAFFGTEKSNEFSGNYQSNYDVLGVKADYYLKDTANTTTTIGNSNAGTSSLGQDTLINFEIDLEKNLNYLIEEKTYYEKIIQVKETTKGLIVDLDQCLPGPDRDWAKRYEEKVTLKSSENELEKNLISLKETKQIISDSKMTIPGSKNIQSSIDKLLSKNDTELAEINFRLEDVTNTTTTLSYIKKEIGSSFETIKLTLHKNLVLFDTDWIKLSKSTQIELLNTAVTNNYIVIKTESGETAQLIVETQNTRARDAVLKMAWDLWKKSTDISVQNELSSYYSSVSNSLSGTVFIERAKTKFNLIKNNSLQTQQLVSDCLVLKLYTLGESEAGLKSIKTAATNSDKNLQESQKIKLMQKRLSEIIKYNPTGIYKPIIISSAKSDLEIKNFLNNQYAIINTGQSLFSTNLVSSPSSISNSILGFENESEKRKYIDSLYNDENLFGKNAYTLAEIFSKDSLSYNNTYEGILFCRNLVKDVSFSNLMNVTQHPCLSGWYKASAFDYRIILSGI